MRFKWSIGVVLMLCLLCTSVVAFTPMVQGRPLPPPEPSGHGWDSLGNKAVLIGLPPGAIVAHFVVIGKNTPLFDELGRPNGVFLGDIVGAADGKPVSTSLAVSSTDDVAHACQNRLFIWTEDGGYKLLASLTVRQPFPETQIWVDNPPVES